LEQNYRSTQNIVNAANVVIAKNLQQFKKNVFSENEEGEKSKYTVHFPMLMKRIS
jgi:DNA helicase-2/ATP-dependent DNA helicase PcrA